MMAAGMFRGRPEGRLDVTEGFCAPAAVRKHESTNV